MASLLHTLGISPMGNSLLKYRCSIKTDFDVNSIAFSPDGTRVAASGSDADGLSFYDIATGERVGFQSYGPPLGRSDTLDWNPVTNLIASPHQLLREICLWNGDSDIELRRKIDCKPEFVEVNKPKINIGGKWVAAVGDTVGSIPPAVRPDLLLSKISNDSSRMVLRLGLTSHSLAWTKTSLVAVGKSWANGLKVELCSLRLGMTEPTRLTLSDSPQTDIQCAVDPNGDRVFVSAWRSEPSLGMGNGFSTLWVIEDASTNPHVVHTHRIPLDTTQKARAANEGARNYSLAYMSGIDRVVLNTFDHSRSPVRLVDPLTGEYEGVNLESKRPNETLAVSSDGSMLATSEVNQIRIFEAC